MKSNTFIFPFRTSAFIHFIILLRFLFMDVDDGALARRLRRPQWWRQNLDSFWQSRDWHVTAELLLVVNRTRVLKRFYLAWKGRRRRGCRLFLKYGRGPPWSGCCRLLAGCRLLPEWDLAGSGCRGRCPVRVCLVVWLPARRLPVVVTKSETCANANCCCG